MAMTDPRHRGQAAVEALLAMALLGVFMLSIIDLGSLIHRVQHAGHVSRLAAFVGAIDSSASDNALQSRLSIERQPTAGSSQDANVSAVGQHAEKGNGSDAGDGNTSTISALMRDWVDVDSELRVATVTVSAMRGSDVNRPWLPSIKRRTVIAIDAGTELSDAEVARRLQTSEHGWSHSAKQSAEVADSVLRRLEHIAAPRRAVGWPGEWVEAWSDLPAGVQSGTAANRKVGRRDE
ncbi:TadE/TadG family type IV pilus assembly protein [Bordetella sp. 15P40C-2]|uniref:TadE/TadG family type IV pilus assembly protein n=1 Tax=Bordetella sp. 15P40C-2 TaxID=2572246 RepID=UPI0013271F1B|nr:TadE family protein [Bordetella sp. 15P40C-2]MVW72115.1 hypothetical protein [Bordetella sp. 15P40C-2]